MNGEQGDEAALALSGKYYDYLCGPEKKTLKQSQVINAYE